MDSFIKIIPQKKVEVKTVVTIHTKQIELIRRYIRERKNVFICGGSGVGKSYVLNEVLEGLNNVELRTEHLKSKSLFLPFIKPSSKHGQYERSLQPKTRPKSTIHKRQNRRQNERFQKDEREPAS